MTVLNHYSYLISAMIVLLLAGQWALSRRTPRALGAFAGIALLLVAVGVLFRTGASTVGAAAEFERALADGRPTLVEFYSNY